MRHYLIDLLCLLQSHFVKLPLWLLQTTASLFTQQQYLRSIVRSHYSAFIGRQGYAGSQQNYSGQGVCAALSG